MKNRNLMLGNVFMFPFEEKMTPCEVSSLVTKSDGTVMVTIKSLIGKYKNVKLTEKELGEQIREIFIDDKFFKELGYEMFPEMEIGGGSTISHIVAEDAYGPAITKMTRGRDDVQYALTGLLIETVDDFQNLMRHCGCSEIADKVNILFKAKYMEA